MAADIDMNDSPITGPEADAYGFNPFAAALARGIAGMKAPAGFVIALDGPWGSGKSSVINLLRHHLKADHGDATLDVKDFNPWWYGGSEALARGFFEVLGDAVSGPLKAAIRRSLKPLGRRLGFVKPLAALAGNVAAGGVPVGSAAIAAMEQLGTERPLVGLYEQLAKTLRDHGRRILIVIDDIDRLDPNDAVLVFQLVKSVGRLPNVLYLLAYDSAVARRQLEHRFGPAAAGYLDKIVQATYAIPVPGRAQLASALIEAVAPVFDDAGTIAKQTRFQNLVHDCVAPWLRTPRDVVRLTNLVTVGWPAIREEANETDFLVLEALKLSHPDVYRAVQRSRDILCETGEDVDRKESIDERRVAYEARLLSGVSEDDRAEVCIALRNLFPRLDEVYKDRFVSWHSLAYRRRDRLACSSLHFATYFRLAPSPEALSPFEIRELLDAVRDTTRLCKLLKGAAQVSGSTWEGNRAELMLEALQDHIGGIPGDAVRSILSALSQVGDDIKENNNTHIIYGWDNFSYTWELIWDIFGKNVDQQERSSILLDIAQESQLGWLIEFADYCWKEHDPESDESRTPSDRRLVTSDAADRLRTIALKAIQRATEAGDLIAHPRLDVLLPCWETLAGDNGEAARQWIDRCLKENANVVRLASMFTQIKDTDWLDLARICDPRRLRDRAFEILKGNIPREHEKVLRRYLGALPSRYGPPGN